MKEHGERCGRMMESCNKDKMGDMMGMCIKQADKMGLTDDQIVKMKPVHIEMQKRRPNSKLTAKLQRSNSWKSWK